MTRPSGQVVVRSVLRAVGAAAVLVTAYYLLPLDHVSTGAVAAILTCELLLLVILVLIQVRWIIISSYPGLRAVEAVATSVPLVLLIFASAYVPMSRTSAAGFGGPLTHTDALYLAVTVFATVGFGDITPKTESARLVVTGQMVVDIVIIGFAIKALTHVVHARKG